MEIESQSIETNTNNSNNCDKVYETIGESNYNNRTNSDVSDGQAIGQSSAVNSYAINRFNNSDLSSAKQEVEDELIESSAGTDTIAPTTGTGSSGVRDRFCWMCHKDKSNILCKQCPRSYHLKCIPTNTSTANNNTNSTTNSDNRSKSNHKSFDSWICVECKDILREEEDLEPLTGDEEPPPKSQLAQMSAEEMSQLLTFALQTIRQSADPTFHKPVSAIVFPDYHQLVRHPMDLSTIERKIQSKRYRSQTAFLADIKWIVHNCIIYNHNNHPLTTNAKYLLRVAKNEMAEMEICPDCFKNFYTITDTSFAEPCRRPHQLVFARVKGYPLWPAKTVRLGKQNDVDCRFFGTHDRAWVAVDSCWLVSEAHPGSKPSKTHKSKFESAMRELAVHIERLNAKFPQKFKYSPQKTAFSANEIFICDEDNQYYNRLIACESRLKSLDSSVNSSANNTTNSSKSNGNNSIVDSNTNTNSSDSIDKAVDDCVPSASKSVVPGVFSLTSDTVFDELKSEIKISNESTNLLNKNVKTNSQIKEDLTAKGCARTARVGKRNVAEALRASKILRTTTSSSTSSSSSPSHRMQSNQSSLLANNSHPMGSSSSAASTPATVSKAKAASQSLPQQLVSSQNNNLREELERLKKQLSFDNAMHRQEIKEIKHNADLVLMEMRQSWVTERDKALDDERQKHELERKLMVAQFDGEKKKLLSALEETKRKQWCAECLKEAQLFCCYDTWYCTYECQKSHWKSHVNVCQQIHKKT